MDSQLTRITVKGYRSVRDCTVSLGAVNILIGANGAGKSNFISVFSFIQKILSGDLQMTVSLCGPSSLLYNGPKITRSVSVQADFGGNAYGFTLEPADNGQMVFADEWFLWNGSAKRLSLGRGHLESKWEAGAGNELDDCVKPVLNARDWRIYHFHDTSRESAMKHECDVHDNLFLHQDAGNLAPYLLRLGREFPQEYARVRSAVRRVNPLFDDFVLEPDAAGNVTLRWRKKGVDAVMGPGQFSDGTLRFVALSTLLLQPVKLRPATIILDEPELGLYPQAIVYLAEMIHSASQTNQVIVSTQSVELVDEFSPEDVVIAEDEGEGTVLKHLDEEALRTWLDEDYSLGHLWMKNVLKGRDA